MNKTYYEQIGTSEQLKTDMENVYNIYFKDKTVDRNQMPKEDFLSLMKILKYTFLYKNSG